MILLIDNYDSFVFNLARYIAELGYKYQVFRNDQISIEDIRKERPSHIIISPGPCTPNEAGISLKLVETFLEEIPILGVCLGHQVIAQACGGKIIKAEHPKHGKAEKIFHNNEGIFKDLPNPLMVARYHSLLVENDSLPNAIQVIATTQKNEIMALKHRDFPVVGVQFHPESVLTEYGHTILYHFLLSL